MDVLSIKPRWRDRLDGNKVDDRLTTVNPYVYAQYATGDFSVNAKVVCMRQQVSISTCFLVMV